MAYVEARTAFQAQDDESLLSISTNFRSRASILTFVNERFGQLLSMPPQPGFTALDAFHGDPTQGICVTALEVKAADENGEASAEQLRDAEAETVAELCARLIGDHPVIDPRTGKRADVGVVRQNGRPPYLRTYADGVWNDNLLSLNQCPL